jgi:PAS domain S-box-containing protein
MGGEEVKPYEYALVTKEGRRVEAILITGLIDYEGEKAILGIATDITEYKKVEKERTRALAEAAAGRIATETIEGMIDGVVIADLDGWIIQKNTASCEVFRTTKEKSIGKHFTEFILQEEVPWVLDVVSKAFKDDKPVRNLELTAVREDGSKFPILINGTLLRNEKGEPNRLLITYRDITELKRLQEERARIERARAEEAERFARELQAKVEELEKLHRLMVGRELKMIQLEEEIKKLRKKAGNARIEKAKMKVRGC